MMATPGELMKGCVENSVAAGAHALFFPHSLGHQLGMDVHDMERLGENFIGYGKRINLHPHLICPKCGGRMKVVAFLTEHAVVDRIIDHLKLTFVAATPPPSHIAPIYHSP
jgi:hypothetical protein